MPISFIAVVIDEFYLHTRMCIGKDVANQALFIDIATLLWAFDIEKAIDKDGKIIVPSRTDFVDEGVVV